MQIALRRIWRHFDRQIRQSLSIDVGDDGPTVPHFDRTCQLLAPQRRGYVGQIVFETRCDNIVLPSCRISLETAEGVNNVEAIAAASPRMHGMSLGPADLAASRGMKTTRVGGGHPDYGVLADPGKDAAAARTFYQQDLWHYTIGKMVDACQAYGLKAFYGPFGDFSDLAACEAQFRNAFLQGCLGAWTLHPSQIDIAKRVFSPDPAEVKFAKRILDAMPDGTGAVMLDGKMQDDATWKQAKVIVDLAKIVASKDPERAALYGAL